MVVVEAKEAEKLPVMMLHVEKHVGNAEKLSGDVACLEEGPLQPPRPHFRAGPPARRPHDPQYPSIPSKTYLTL